MKLLCGPVPTFRENKRILSSTWVYSSSGVRRGAVCLAKSQAFNFHLENSPHVRRAVYGAEGNTCVLYRTAMGQRHCSICPTHSMRQPNPTTSIQTRPHIRGLMKARNIAACPNKIVGYCPARACTASAPRRWLLPHGITLTGGGNTKRRVFLLARVHVCTH